MDLSRWLKDDLGMLHMSEADLNALMYHPRHGSLCRKFVQFLVESTLCKEKYPNVFAREDLDGANLKFEEKSKELHTTVTELGLHIKDCEDQQRELDFLKDKLEYMKIVENLHLESIKILERIVNRPNENLDQICHKLQSKEYLKNCDLKELHSSELSDLLEEISDEMKQGKLNDSDNLSLTRKQQMQIVQKEHNKLLQDAETMHKAVRAVLGEIMKKIGQIDYSKLEVEPRPIMDDLVGLKAPVCDEVVIEENLEEKESREFNDNLLTEVIQLEQEVVDRSDRYKAERSEITRRFKRELKELMNLKQDLDSLEAYIAE